MGSTDAPPGYSGVWTQQLSELSFRGISDPTRRSIEHYLKAYASTHINSPGLAPVVERMLFKTDEGSGTGMDYRGLTTRPRCRGCGTRPAPTPVQGDQPAGLSLPKEWPSYAASPHADNARPLPLPGLRVLGLQRDRRILQAAALRL